MIAVPVLIEAHRMAYAAFAQIVRAEPKDTLAVKVADATAHAVLFALFAEPCRSLADVNAKAAYLLDEIEGDLADYAQEERHIRAILSSLRGPARDDGEPSP